MNKKEIWKTVIIPTTLITLFYFMGSTIYKKSEEAYYTKKEKEGIGNIWCADLRGTDKDIFVQKWDSLFVSPGYADENKDFFLSLTEEINAYIKMGFLEEKVYNFRKVIHKDGINTGLLEDVKTGERIYEFNMYDKTINQLDRALIHYINGKCQ